MIPSKTKPLPLPGGNEMIFVIEDTGYLRELIQVLLKRSGYQVLAFGVPEDALRAASDYVGPLPLLITDVVMPGMSGIELAERFLDIRPETKVLYTSGYAKDAIARQGNLATHFLAKPFIPEDLMKKVRKILDAK